MKTTSILMVFAAALLVFGTSCEKDNIPTIDPADQLALTEIEAAYDNAKIYNDSLQYCMEPGQGCGQGTIEHYDSMFHHHEANWKHQHLNYSHKNPSDDHGHSNNGMRNGGSNMHCNCMGKGHQTSHHQSMENLVNAHQALHR